jgi:Fic family protein
MADLERRRWDSLLESEVLLARRDRRSCSYETYIPDKLSGRTFTFTGAASADVADAERNIARLDQDAVTLVDTEALARLLLRAEAVASSKIEGLEIGGRRLLRADAAKDLGEAPTDVTAIEVLSNIEAMSFATQMASKNKSISIDSVLAVHRRLMASTAQAKGAGQLRTKQNWIGGSSYNPCSAAFIPPPPEMVKSFLQDLCTFCNTDSLPTVAQAAIAHSQFETIHPFADGNGRVGRVLIYMVMRRRGLITRTLPPISLVLATRSRDYAQGLAATRYIGPPDSPHAQSGINRWTEIFAAACNQAVNEAEAFENRIRDLEQAWRKRLGKLRSKSAIDVLLKKLPGTPIVTVRTAANLLGRSVQAVNEAIPRLVDASILTPITAGKRHRAFEARELITAFTALERRLASPSGNRRVAPPARRVPYRKS